MRINQFYGDFPKPGDLSGLTLAGKEASLEQGVYVLQVAGFWFHVLTIADTVTAVNGKTFDNSTDSIKYVQGLKLGSKVKVTYTARTKKRLPL